MRVEERADRVSDVGATAAGGEAVVVRRPTDRVALDLEQRAVDGAPEGRAARASCECQLTRQLGASVGCVSRERQLRPLTCTRRPRRPPHRSWPCAATCATVSAPRARTRRRTGAAGSLLGGIGLLGWARTCGGMRSTAISKLVPQTLDAVDSTWHRVRQASNVLQSGP